jgi:hypothetical protein
MLLFIAAMLLITGSARAWHNKGHMAVARIAWQKLVDDGLDRKAIQFLNSHPHKDMFLAAGRPEGVDEDEWLFVQAATWADWVRRPLAPELDELSANVIRDEFSKPVWHPIRPEPKRSRSSA